MFDDEIKILYFLYKFNSVFAYFQIFKTIELSSAYVALF